MTFNKLFFNLLNQQAACSEIENLIREVKDWGSHLNKIALKGFVRDQIRNEAQIEVTIVVSFYRGLRSEIDSEMTKEE